MITIYVYKQETNEFSNEVVGDYKDYLPAFTTRVKPPKCKKHETALWNGKSWDIKPDYRKETWFDKDGNSIEIDFIGNPVEKGLTAERPKQPEPSLKDVQKILLERVDSAAENERLKYITDGVGQSMTYQEKVNQAAQYSKAYHVYLADPKNIDEPNTNEYPLLKASLGIDGDTLLEVSETVTHAYAQWQQIGAAIEAIRLKTKAAIDEAKTIDEAQSIFDSIEWSKA